MAKYFYANTWHPELFKVYDRWFNSDSANTVIYNGKNWCRIPFSKIARVEFNNTTGLSDFYVSFECVPHPVDREHLRGSDMYRDEEGRASAIGFYSYVYFHCVNSTVTERQIFQKYDKLHEYNTNDTIRQQYLEKWLQTGIWDGGYDWTDHTVSTGFGLKDTLFKEPSFKVHIHISEGKGEVTTNVGRGTNKIDYLNHVDYLYMSGVYIRNVIISEEPISFSDTIREVTVDSIAGSGWYTSNGKTYTENVNATATIKLNSASLAEAKRAIEARKFAFSGVSNRQGERINALEVKRANEAHQSLVDIGEHTFGSSWSVNSPSEITDTLTLTTRKVVGK